MTELLRRFALVGLAAYGLLAATPARADHGPEPADPALSAYLLVAESYWGAAPEPCVGEAGEPVPVHVALFDDPDPWISARSAQPGCRIWLDRDHWPASPSRRRCLEIAHEWGHLLGHGHTKHGLMSEEASGDVPGCDPFPGRRARTRVVQLRGTPRLARMMRRFLRGPG
jgi:hypothetical protein